ncbi:Uncharacterised protein [Mycobacteroides abscessus subsp. abscessus]|uniref:hypothetical protein n=1 Tax=Mycobacteroides abscessus TaxID=36809 RepID=UPI0009A8795C|nr:hypothetical protein [Mycobacteroides abscessus]SKQ48055.1 Uncharacterised protein [Mycobacteroides abscessus subsp. massiliense]SLF34013.1 Uncharacterised protein [Mycobacteroides abscessus subsp. abscessus]SLF35359.1 Uncharacterised protein [Mycobacteroides abscessus subsp. abscessus]SLF35674.1 Uncharacterised protein [Mycobacteroides abscessus subsp. abscessus]SLH08497.1 Uncharacterised protein [Mycobacteroides abscessus subsp. abscessus]
MTTYLVTYDLVAPGRDYKKLFEYLKSHGSWAHPLESTWLIVSSLSALDLCNAIASHVDTNDKVLVVKSAGVGAWRRLTQKLTDWLHEYL